MENDDYSHFSSPTYARGFVRTYARALGLDEYKILRQLDNKLPEDDTATFVPEGGMPYVPEPHSKALHVSSAPRTGLYVVVALGLGVMTVIAFVLFQAYRAGELPRYFAGNSNSAESALTPAATNLTQVPDNEAPQHALPVDANDTTHSVRALPVDLNALPGPAVKPASVSPAAKAVTVTPGAATAVPSTSPAPTEVAVNDPAPVISPSPASSTPPVTLPVAQPVDAADDAGGKAPPRALPVDPSELAAAENSAPASTAPAVQESSANPRGKRSSSQRRAIPSSASPPLIPRVTRSFTTASCARARLFPSAGRDIPSTSAFRPPSILCWMAFTTARTVIASLPKPFRLNPTSRDRRPLSSAGEGWPGLARLRQKSGRF